MGTRLEYDDNGNLVAVREESADHAIGVMEACKALQSCGMTGSREMKHLAEFPGFLIEKYCNDNGIEWNEWFQNPVHARRMLNDPALAYFRIDTSRVSSRGE
jgi:hypothetical protein